MNKTTKYILAGLVIIIMLMGSFSGGFLVGYFVPSDGSTTSIELPISLGNSTPSGTETLFKPFWDTWQIVHEQYVDQPVDDVALMRGAIRGMLESLGDKHTSYMDPQQYSDANATLSGNYEGIGAYVDTGGDYLTITSPIPESPAEKAGLKPGDQIIAIDGVDMTGTPPELARQKVLGPAGTTVTLTIQREGVEKPFDVQVTRAQITIPTVESEMLDGNIAYVRLNTFGDNTTADLKTALQDLMAQNPKGLILDLRNNGGGYLTTAVEVVSEFLPKDEIVLYERYGDGTNDSYTSLGDGLALDIPMVVLINEGSASASEIVAGALQDYGRAQLVGMVSYGKGSVQNWIPLENNQGAVKVTIAKWLTPKERAIDGKGLTPDVTVELTEEDFNANRDPQLDKAIELLK